MVTLWWKNLTDTTWVRWSKSHHINNILKQILILTVLTDININTLIKNVLSELYSDYEKVLFLIPYEKQNILYKIKEYAINGVIEYLDSGISYECSVPDYIGEKYKEYKKAEVK